MKKGSLVLYKNSCAIVTECDGDKYSIRWRTGEGKSARDATQKARAKDVALLHDGPAPSLEAALDFSDSAIDGQIAEAHELLLSDESFKNSSVTLKELSEIARGSFKVEECWAMFSALSRSAEFEADGDALKRGEIAFFPRSEERVAAVKKKAEEKRNEAAEREAFVERLKSRSLKLPDDSKFMGDVEALALGQSEKSRALADAKIAQTAENAHKILLETGMWDETRNPFPTRFGFALSSADKGLDSPPDEEREKVPGVAWAIDNKWADDPDDAVSFDGENLWVHIADPAAAVEPDSEIDREARARGATLYLPEGASRMLAETSIADYALGLNETSRALSFKLSIDEKGCVAACDVLKTTVDVKRLTYEKATELKDSPELAPLFKIAHESLARRTAAGAKSINLGDVHISVDARTKKVSIESEARTEAADMVCEMMILAGEGAARFAFERSIPFPFVSQEPPEIPGDIPPGLAGEFKILRAMRKRSVGVTPAPHAALGVAVYSQVTSPLRRYGDLIAHEQLRAFLGGRALIESDDMLSRVAAGDAASVAARKASRCSETHWKLVYLMQNKDWTGKAVCVDRKGSLALLYIPSLDMQATIIPRKKLSLNDETSVRAMNIDIPNQHVDFAML